MEVPKQFAGLPIIGPDEAADTVLAPIRADQDLTVDGSRRHRFAVAQLGIGELDLPDHLPGLGIERHQLRVQCAQVNHVAIDSNAAIVRAATVGRDRSHLVLVVPDLLTCPGIKRVHVAHGGRNVHHAVHHDWRGLHCLYDLGLKDPGRAQLTNVGAVDLSRRIIAGLVIIGVGVQEIIAITG